MSTQCCAKFVFVHLICGSILLFSNAQPKIEFFQSVNGSEVIISSLIATINGTSFSLICKMISTGVNIDSGKHFDNRVVWSKKRRKSRFPSINDLVLMQHSFPDANLSFINVTLKDQGVYFCTSIKYKLLKVLTLIVKSGFPLSNTSRKEISNIQSRDSIRRTSRDIILVPSSHYNYTGDFKQFAYTDSSVDDYSSKNNVHLEFTSKNDLPSWFYKDKDHDNSENFETHNLLPKFLYLMIGGVLLFVVVFVAVQCCHGDNNDTPPDLINCQSRNRTITNRSTMCSHLVCIQNRSTHPFADCVRQTNDARRLPVRDSNNERLRITHLDLPPTYDDSTTSLARHSKHKLGEPKNVLTTEVLNYCDSYTLPPSYEEALCNKENSYGSSSTARDCSAEDAN